MNSVQQIIKWILISLAGLLVIFLIVQDMALTGQLEFKTNLKDYTPRISSLGPPRRIEINKNVIIKEEPVYFDVYLPRDFDKIILEFELQNKNPQIKIGALINDQDMELKHLDDQPGEGFIKKSVEFDSLARFLKKGKIRFAVSVPELTKPVEIKNLTVKMIRPNLAQENIFDNIYKYLTFWKNEIK